MLALVGEGGQMHRSLAKVVKCILFFPFRDLIGVRWHSWAGVIRPKNVPTLAAVPFDATK
jgi:hypothetical protein